MLVEAGVAGGAGVGSEGGDLVAGAVGVGVGGVGGAAGASAAAGAVGGVKGSPQTLRRCRWAGCLWDRWGHRGR